MAVAFLGKLYGFVAGFADRFDIFSNAFDGVAGCCKQRCRQQDYSCDFAHVNSSYSFNQVDIDRIENLKRLQMFPVSMLSDRPVACFPNGLDVLTKSLDGVARRNEQRS
jgi:hypothetical protein